MFLMGHQDLELVTYMFCNCLSTYLVSNIHQKYWWSQLRWSAYVFSQLVDKQANQFIETDIKSDGITSNRMDMIYPH